MATQLPYITQGHQKHDVHWMVISPGHSGVLCVACLVEQVENDEAPLVQRKVVLSLLASLLGDSKEVAAKFEENLLLCRHMIDIVTGSFFKHEQHVDPAIKDTTAECHQIMQCVSNCFIGILEVGGLASFQYWWRDYETKNIKLCQLILETAESEDLVWYAIDKFHFQLQDSQDLVSVSPYLLLLGRLLVISPAYGFHLLHKHESLLLLVLRLLSQTSDESCLCSVIYIFIHLLDDSLQSDVSLAVRRSVNQVLVSLLTCAESVDLRVNLLALLKNILKHTDENTVKLLMAPNSDNKYLVMGLKKMLITKQEVLQTASAHCVTALMSCSKDESTVTQILESDLAEFLFESLHSQSGPQLDSVYQCLHLLTDYEQFFTRCHAVYGVESILRSLCVVMDVKNYRLMEKGFCLLANILHRQPLGIPLFVNVTSVKQCVHLVRQALAQSHPAVFLQALTVARPLVSKQYLPWVYRCEVVEDLLKVACCQMMDLHTSLCHGRHTQTRMGRQVDWQNPLVAFSDLITVCCRVCGESVLRSSSEMDERQWMNVEGTLSLLVSAAERHLAPYIQSVFESEECPPALKTVLTCMNELYSQTGRGMTQMSLMFTQSGVIIQAPVVKYRAAADVCDGIDKFLENVYRDLLEDLTPLNPSLPSWLVSGVATIKLQSADPCHLLPVMEQSEDAAWAVLMILYFSYLHSHSWVECCDLQSLLQCFLANSPDLSGLPPLVIRCLAFLVACSSGDAVANTPQPFQYHTGNLTDLLESCPVAVWYTHHPVVICWVFSEGSRAQQLGHTLLEYWLPLIDVKSLETTLSSTTAQCSHTGPQHAVPEQQHPDTDPHPADTEPHLTDAEQQQTDIVLHHSDSEQHHADAENWQRGDAERQQQKAMERDHEITDTDKMMSEMAYPDTDTQLLVELAHNSAFIHTLMTVLVARQEIAAIAANVAEHLSGMLCEEVPDKSASASPSTVSVVLDTCTTLFQQLFLQDSLPQDYQVINMLKVMIILMRGSGSNTCDAFNVKSVYHVVKFVGSQEDDTQSESIKWCVEYLLTYTDDRIVADCLCIGPILVQNKGFMMKLDRILSGSCHTEVDSVMRLVSWLADTTGPEGEVPYQIHVSHIFLLDVVTTGDGATPAGGLSLLSAALSVPPSTQGPVVFSRDRLIQDTPLFTARDVRTLYFHLQQLVCQDCQVVFNCALECTYKLYKYAAAVHQALASQLSSQPWNQLWLESVLHAAGDQGGLSPEMLQLLQMLSDFPTCQELIAVSGEPFLHAVLKSPLQEHQAQRVTHILSKCMLVLKKTVKPHLLQQVENHLGRPVH